MQNRSILLWTLTTHFIKHGKSSNRALVTARQCLFELNKIATPKKKSSVLLLEDNTHFSLNTLITTHMPRLILNEAVIRGKKVPIPDPTRNSLELQKVFLLNLLKTAMQGTQYREYPYALAAQLQALVARVKQSSPDKSVEEFYNNIKQNRYLMKKFYKNKMSRIVKTSNVNKKSKFSAM